MSIAIYDKDLTIVSLLQLTLKSNNIEVKTFTAQNQVVPYLQETNIDCLIIGLPIEKGPILRFLKNIITSLDYILPIMILANNQDFSFDVHTMVSSIIDKKDYEELFFIAEIEELIKFKKRMDTI